MFNESKCLSYLYLHHSHRRLLEHFRFELLYPQGLFYHDYHHLKNRIIFLLSKNLDVYFLPLKGVSRGEIT